MQYFPPIWAPIGVFCGAIDREKELNLPWTIDLGEFAQYLDHEGALCSPTTLLEFKN